MKTNKNHSPLEFVLLPVGLAIKWKNSKESLLDFPLLRRCCPCALCGGEVDALGNKYGGANFNVSKDILIIKYSTVGHYGIKLYFSDGHSDGIYTFNKLYQLSFLNND